jgi:hypothetical protein
MPLPPRTPTTVAELEQLHDRLWNDPRRRDDRTQFHECDSCGAAVRWIANLGSDRGGSMPIVTGVVATAATWDPLVHAGLVAVLRDRTGFTVSRTTTRDELDDALLYRCHWDSCAHAREERDRIAGERQRTASADPHPAAEHPDALRRYEAWLRERSSQPRPNG